MTKTKWQKSASLLLAICMLFTVVPAFAIGGSEGYLDESETTTPQTPARRRRTRPSWAF